VQKATEGILPFYTEGNYRRCKVTTLVQTTADELLRLPRGRNRYELIQGELKTMAPAGYEHGTLAALITSLLLMHVRAQKLGAVTASETGFKLASNPDTVRAPDAAFISQKRLDEVGPVQGYWPGAPDLAVEVVSPNDLYTEVSDKVAEWLEAGSGMVVVVNPRRQQVFVHAPDTDVKVLGVDDTLDGGEVVPGWQLPIKELFES
jgi:Uma2 family endonuclease